MNITAKERILELIEVVTESKSTDERNPEAKREGQNPTQVGEPKSMKEGVDLKGDSLTKESRKHKNPFRSRKTVWTVAWDARVICGYRIKSRKPPSYQINV